MKKKEKKSGNIYLYFPILNTGLPIIFTLLEFVSYQHCVSTILPVNSRLSSLKTTSFFLLFSVFLQMFGPDTKFKFEC